MNAIRNNIPNAITSLNLLFGSMACIMAFSCFDPVCGGLKGYQCAFILIALSAVADFLDGLVARLLHAVSAIGAELDSLADLVSFGTYALENYQYFSVLRTYLQNTHFILAVHLSRCEI